MKENKAGRYGEETAVRYLQDRGFLIRERNLRLLRHEMDIIAEKEELLVFIEVKTRSNEVYGKGFEHVTVAKQKRLIRFAQLYLLQNRLEKQVRFDVISIMINRENGKATRIDHFPNAFQL